MKYEKISVTPAVITWARTRAGFSLDEARKRFKAIKDWEEGKASPSYPQLEQMAERFKVPVAVFFFPEPPDVPSVSESFRTLPQKEIERLPPRIRYLVRKAKAFQINLAELTGEEYPAERLILHELEFSSSVSVSTMASEVREYLGISIEEQTDWPNDDIAFHNWREALTEVGIAVFKDAFRDPGYSGFCLYDDKYPIIYVNNSSSKTRQIFTLFHELAHLLFHTSGIDAFDDDFIERLSENEQKVEVSCNRFAAEFLLPNRVFDAVFSELSPTEETAEKIANQFHVSREFIFRRFLDRGLVSQAEYEEAARRWADEKRAGSGGDYYRNVIAYLGRVYIDLAFTRYYQNRIDDIQLAEYLDIKPKNIDKLEEYVQRSAE